MHTYFSGSSQQAKAILGAWQEANPERLCKELGQAKLLALNSDDSAEAERVELLCAIANELEESGQSIGENGSEVYRKLLRHLAFPEREYQYPSLAWFARPAQAPAVSLLQ